MQLPIQRLIHNYPNDDAFMRAFRSGARDTFYYVYQTTHPFLKHYVGKFLHNPIDAEDIIGAAFLNLYRDREKIISIQHIRRWLHVTVHNMAISFLRDQKKQLDTLCDLKYLTPDADELDNRQYIFETLNSEIDRLPPQRKKIVRLYFYERLPTNEIARRLQLRPQTVLNHKSKAIGALRETLKLAIL